MLFINVLRDGAGVMSISEGQYFNATLTRRISAADQLQITTPQDYDIIPYDYLILYESGTMIGRFIVVTVEETNAEDGTQMARITAEPYAIYMLKCTAVPSQYYFDWVNITQSLPLFSDLVDTEHNNPNLTENLHITFRIVNNAPYTPPKPDITGSPKPLIKRVDVPTALEGLTTICAPSDARWRCRPDLLVGVNTDTTVIEIGLFGELKNVEVKSGANTTTPALMSRQHLYDNAKRIISVDDVVTDCFCEGTNWIDSMNHERDITLLANNVVAPNGYTLIYINFPNGKQSMSLSKNTDKNGVPFLHRRWTRLRVPAIVPPNAPAYADPLVDPDLETSVQSLINVAASYMDIYSEPLETWQVEIPGSLIGDNCFVGDRIHAVLSSKRGEFNGSIYLIGDTTNWERGGVIRSTIELSNRLDSLTDPLGENFKASEAARKTMQEVFLPAPPP